MHNAWVHQHRGTRRHLDVLLTTEVGAAPTGDHPDGKTLVGMRGVADLAPIPTRLASTNGNPGSRQNRDTSIIPYPIGRRSAPDTTRL